MTTTLDAARSVMSVAWCATHLQRGQVKPPDCSLASCPTNACPAAPSAFRCGKPMRTCTHHTPGSARTIHLAPGRSSSGKCAGHHSALHHGGCCGGGRRRGRRRVRHDELLQVVLVESDAVRPIRLLHRRANWSAQACCRRHTKLTVLGWTSALCFAAA